MTLNYNCTGVRRKELVHAIEELTGLKARYAFMPTQAYSIGPYTVSKTGELSQEEGTDAGQLVEALSERGFQAETPEEQKSISFCISYPRSKISDEGICRLKKLLEAKGSLIKKALGIAALPVEIGEETLSFPWFEQMPGTDEIAAYSRFLCALCAFAEKQKRVTAREKETDNEKYAFRCFLLRLGFIGDEPELKLARKVLLSKLSGSGAFRSGRKKERVEEPAEATTAQDGAAEGGTAKEESENA